MNPKVALRSNTDWQCPFYIRMLAPDEPGVLSRIAQCFADEGVSIAGVTQKGEQRDGRVTLVVITHVAGEKSMQRSIAALAGSPR